ncbi:MAG TPA: 6-phosphogluconolactonase [Gaiellaceae bacterium]|nr:6-phosphogluconolactonase [Gaiellaceae bacterium]HYA08194.1 6-phosphogluconolactonase [Gaiellaceae bacterium]
MTLYGVELVRVADAEEAARVIADELVAAARAGQSIVLTGGTTPGHAYKLAAEAEPDWSGAALWWGDERSVPSEDERSNFRLARESLLAGLSAQPREVHRIRGELGAEAAAAEYDAELDGARLDLVLLGVGTDGHTASLFPGQPTLDERSRRAIRAEAKLDPFVERVTLTVPVLCSAPEVLFLVTGEPKAEAVERAFGRPPDRGTPASMVRSAGGRTRLVADAAAASHLDA